MQKMKTALVLIVGLLAGSGAMYFSQKFLCLSEPFSATTTDNDSAQIIEEESQPPQMVKGDLDNVPWQKHVYALDRAIRKGDIFGDERTKAQDEVDEYYRLCEAAGGDYYPFIRTSKIEKLRHWFQGVEHFKNHIEPYKTNNQSYWLALMRAIGDEGDDFFEYANREYYKFIVDDKDDGIVGWDDIRQKFAKDVFGIDHPISDRGFYQYISQNFEDAVSVETYLKFWNHWRPKRPE